MRESLGGSLLLSIVLVVGGLIMAVFVSILAFSKAYRVKNSIVEIIENRKGYDTATASVINGSLKEYGYDASLPKKCSSIKSKLNKGGKYVSSNLNDSTKISNPGYNYCVFEICDDVNTYGGVTSCDDDKGKYYVVVTFVQMEVPLVHDFLDIPVYSETKKVGKIYNY